MKVKHIIGGTAFSLILFVTYLCFDEFGDREEFKYVVDVYDGLKFDTKDLKIFVYKLPEEYNEAILNKNQELLDTYPQQFSMGREEWNCYNNIFKTEITFHQILLESPVVTNDPEEADFFYVPVYTVCKMNLHLPINVNLSVAFHQRLLNYLRETYPYWDRKQGSDHLFLVSQGVGANLIGRDIYQTAIILTVNSDLNDPAYSTEKDISIPPDVSLRPNFLEPQYRRYQAFMGGSLGMWKPSYSKGVRQAIATQFSNITDWIIFERYGLLNDDMKHFYSHLMGNSKFCLAPEGLFAFTPRISEAMRSGCIPVIISDSFVPPFSKMLDYSSFALHLSPKNLTSLPGLIRYALIHLQYNSPPQPGDAFFMIMNELYIKKNKLKNL